MKDFPVSLSLIACNKFFEVEDTGHFFSLALFCRDVY